MADKLKMMSKDIVQDNVEYISLRFPNAIIETIENGFVVKKIDFDVLKQELSKAIVDEKQERYQMSWPDKKKSTVLANSKINGTLRPLKEKSLDFDNTENIYIEGDNLDCLKLLRETYLHKVKMIYIDPPYNTGNDFVYNDDFSKTERDYLDNSGQYDDLGNRMFVNNESRGRFHTDWLNMIYPRLKIAKDFLSEDGVVFISIDDGEQANLKKVCDEIFGEHNFITSMIWSAGRKNDSKYISVSHEYILCYVKNINYLIENKIIWRERKQGLDEIYSEYNMLLKKYKNDYSLMEVELKKWYKMLPDNHPAKNHQHYDHIDEKGIFFPDNASWPGGGGPKYEVLHPVTKKPVKVPSRGWIYPTKQRMDEMIAAGKIYFGKDETYVPCVKSYLKDREFSTPYSVFYKDGRAATKRLMQLLGGMAFQNPKDEDIIKSLIAFTLSNDRSIVLDFFSGSATTAHAVMQLNSEDGGKRRYILIQLPENCDEKSEAFKLGFKNICEIGEERIRRAGKKIKDEAGIFGNDLDIGFRVLKLDSSNMTDVYYNPKETTQSLLGSLVDNVKPDRTPLDLLFQVMLELGIELSAKIEERTISGKKCFIVNENDIVACFDSEVNEEVIKELAKIKPIYAVFRDGVFENDAANINCEQIFKSISPSSTIKVL